MVSITFSQYASLRDLLTGQLEILKKKTVLFSGTKAINAEIVAVSLLFNRYQFMSHVDDFYHDYGPMKNMKFRLYELAALSYFLSDCAGLPDHIEKLNTEIKALIKPYEYNQDKSEFQIWLEEKFQDYEITFTELRDQHFDTFKTYEEEFSREKTLKLAT